MLSLALVGIPSGRGCKEVMGLDLTEQSLKERKKKKGGGGGEGTSGFTHRNEMQRDAEKWMD